MLTGYEDVFRIRVVQFRIIHSVSGNELIIITLKIGRRKDVYRKKPKEPRKPSPRLFVFSCAFQACS